MNEPGPVFHRPDRPQKQTGHTKLIGKFGPVMNQDIKTSIEELSPAFCRHRTALPLGDLHPCISPEAFIAPNATVVGDMELGDKVFVWSGAVIRADENEVYIGAMTNVLENAVITADSPHSDISIDTDGTGGRVEGIPGKVKIGPFCTIGANSMLRACTLEHSVAIGAGSVICEGALIEAGAVIEPGSIVPPGRRVPGGQRWGGTPVQFIEEIADAAEANDELAKFHHERAQSFIFSCYPLYEPDYSMLHRMADKAIKEGL